MKSMKQKDQAHGYARDTIIRTILNHYKTKLEDLSMEELEEELYAEEETQSFGEIPFAASSLLNIGLEQARPSDYEIKLEGEDLIKQARKEGFIITPKTTPVDQRMVSKWKRHENYSKKIARDTLRHQQNASPITERKKRFTEELESARTESNEDLIYLEQHAHREEQ